MRRAASLAGALVVIATGAGARAATEEAEEAEPRTTGPVYVVWIAPIDCPRQPDVSAEIDRLLGAQPRRSREGVEVRARVARVEGADPARAWHAEIEIASGADVERRALDGESCASVAHAVAVIAAVASDAATTTPPRARARSIVVDASAAIDVGTLPRAALGIGLGLGFRPSWLEVGVDGAFFPSVHAASPRPDAGADVSLLRGAARGCGFVTLEPIALGPCAVLGVDAIRAHGTGSDRPADASETLFSAGADLVLRAKIAAIAYVRVASGVRFPFGRPTFVVAGAGPVHKPAPVTAPVAVGAEIDF